MHQDSWLKPAHVLPLPLKWHGLRRAKAHHVSTELRERSWFRRWSSATRTTWATSYASSWEDAGSAVAEAVYGLQTLEALRASTSLLIVVPDLDLQRLDGIGAMRAVTQDAQLAARHAFVLVMALGYHRYQAS